MQLVALYQGITLLCIEFAIYISIWLRDVLKKHSTWDFFFFFPVQIINAWYESINHPLYLIQVSDSMSESNHKC